MATTYTVTYDANGGSNAPSPDKKIYGQALMLTNDVPTPPAGVYYKSYTVTFNANGGTCDQDIMTSTTTITYDRFGYWATNPDGSGSLYWPGDLYTDNNDVILYAQYMWGSESLGITLPTPSRDNYDFLGWSENEYDTSGITGQYYPSKDITLYAIWKIKTYTVTYDANGGSFSNNSTENMVMYEADTKFEFYGTYEEPTRTNYSFAGWYIDSNCTDGNEFDLNNITSSVTVYALWKLMGHVRIYDSAGEFSPYQVLIYDGSGWNQYIPYIYTESGWEIYSG